VTLRRPLSGPAVLLAAIALAALWPVSAYVKSPAAFPLLLAALAAGAVTITRPEFGLAIVVALSPLTNFVVNRDKPIQTLIPVLTVGLLAWGALVVRREGRLSTRGLTLPVLLFAGVALASSMHAIAPSQAINKLLLVFTASALFLAVVQVCRNAQAPLVVVGGCIAALLIGGLHGVIQQVTGTYGDAGFVADGEVIARVQGSFGHANQYAGFMAFLIPLALALLVTRETTPRLRVFACGALVAGLAGLTFSYTRGAMIGLVAGGLLWLAVIRPRAAAMSVVLVVIGALALAPGSLKDRFTQGDSGDVTLRQDLWGSALDIYSGSPVLGVGLSNFKEGYARLPASLANASQRRLLHNRQILIPPHAANLFLNVLAEEGLVGLVALLLLMLSALAAAYRGRRSADPVTRAVCAAVGAGVLGIAFHSIFEVTLFSELIVPLFALLGVCAALVAQERERSTSAA
jgi:O-antigen ligase